MHEKCLGQDKYSEDETRDRKYWHSLLLNLEESRKDKQLIEKKKDREREDETTAHTFIAHSCFNSVSRSIPYPLHAVLFPTIVST